jgi:MFS family permease
VVISLAPVSAGLQILAVVVAPVAIYAFFPPLQTTLVELVPPRRHGIVYALHMFFLSGIGAAAGPFVIGAVSDWSGNLLAALWLIVVGLVVAAASIIRTGRRIRAVDELA